MVKKKHFDKKKYVPVKITDAELLKPGIGEPIERTGEKYQGVVVTRAH